MCLIGVFYIQSLFSSSSSFYRLVEKNIKNNHIKKCVIIQIL